jgi:hypothetical protein
MKTKLMLATGIVLALVSTATLSSSASAQQSRMKECADQWGKLKAAKQTAGKTYREFSKECMSQASPAAAPSTSTQAKPAAETKPAPAPAAKTTAPATPAAKPSNGRQAMIARERACGAEWKADKAAGKVAAGMTWPKYWSACNTRKKAEGM